MLSQGQPWLVNAIANQIVAEILQNDYSIEDGKEQLYRYLDKVGLNEGYLVIYETRDKSWDEKIYWKEIEYHDKKIIMVGI